MITTYGYAHLALYIFITESLKINFWQLQESSRSMWIAGAVILLLAVISARPVTFRLPGSWLR